MAARAIPLDVSAAPVLEWREAEARAEVAECLRLAPTLSLEGLRQTIPFTDQALVERSLNALRKAGLK